MSVVVMLLVLLVIFLFSFGKELEKIIQQKVQLSASAKRSGIIIWLLLAVVTGVIYVDLLDDYLPYGLLFFLFGMGVTLIVGIVDIVIKTRYFKIPGFLLIFMFVSYIVVFLIKVS